jgi:hypothetical protein
VSTSSMFRWLIGSALVMLVLSSIGVAQVQSPSEAYQGYLAAAKKATSLDELLPHLSKEYRAMLTAQPKDNKGVWLERLKESADMTEVKIGKETITGSKCTLEATAKSHRGMALKGKVFLVKEDGGWKLDEEGWST